MIDFKKLAERIKQLEYCQDEEDKIPEVGVATVIEWLQRKRVALESLLAIFDREDPLGKMAHSFTKTALDELIITISDLKESSSEESTRV